MNRQKKTCQLLNVHRNNDVGKKTETHLAELLVLKPGTFEVEISAEKETCISPGIDQVDRIGPIRR